MISLPDVSFLSDKIFKNEKNNKANLWIFVCLTGAHILKLISKYLHLIYIYCFSFIPWRWWKSDSFDLSEKGWGFSIDMIIYSGMLNNLSFLSLLIRAEKPKKFSKDRFLNMYLNSPDKGTEPPNRARWVYSHTCLIL